MFADLVDAVFKGSLLDLGKDYFVTVVGFDGLFVFFLVFLVGLIVSDIDNQSLDLIKE